MTNLEAKQYKKEFRPNGQMFIVHRNSKNEERAILLRQAEQWTQFEDLLKEASYTEVME